MSFLFFRVEHNERVNTDLLKYTKKNCKAINCGPWTLLDYFKPEEAIYMASVSTNHALPYYKFGRPFDSEINDVVMGPNGKEDKNIKEHYVFGCASHGLIKKYFPTHYTKILHSHGFHIGIYSSNHVYSSKFQSVMNIDKPYEYIGNKKLV